MATHSDDARTAGVLKPMSAVTNKRRAMSVDAIAKMDMEGAQQLIVQLKTFLHTTLVNPKLNQYLAGRGIDYSAFAAKLALRVRLVLQQCEASIAHMKQQQQPQQHPYPAQNGAAETHQHHSIPAVAVEQPHNYVFAQKDARSVQKILAAVNNVLDLEDELALTAGVSLQPHVPCKSTGAEEGTAMATHAIMTETMTPVIDGTAVRQRNIRNRAEGFRHDQVPSHKRFKTAHSFAALSAQHQQGKKQGSLLESGQKQEVHVDNVISLLDRTPFHLLQRLSQPIRQVYEAMTNPLSRSGGRLHQIRIVRNLSTSVIHKRASEHQSPHSRQQQQQWEEQVASTPTRARSAAPPAAADLPSTSTMSPLITTAPTLEDELAVLRKKNLPTQEALFASSKLDVRRTSVVSSTGGRKSAIAVHISPAGGYAVPWLNVIVHVDDYPGIEPICELHGVPELQTAFHVGLTKLIASKPKPLRVFSIVQCYIDFLVFFLGASRQS